MFRKECVSRVLVCLFFIFVWLRYILGETTMLLLLPVVGIALFFVNFKGLFSGKKIALIFIFWFFVFLLFSLLSAVRTDFYSVYFVFLGFSGFIIAFVLFVDKRFSYYLSSFLFYLFFLFSVVVIFADSRPAYDSLNNMFPDASRNMVGAIAIFLLSFNMLSAYREKKVIPLLPLLCSFVLVVSAYGRSSIIALAILSLTYFLFYCKRYFFSVLLLSLMLSLAIPFLGIDYENYFLRFTQSGLESLRAQMYAEYLVSLDLIGVVFGGSVLESPLISSFDGNSHSSYIRSHSYYGLLIILFIGFCFSLVALRGRVNVVVFGVLIAYVFRVSFEQIAFFDVFDFLFFYCILFLWYGSSEPMPLPKRQGCSALKNT